MRGLRRLRICVMALAVLFTVGAPGIGAAHDRLGRRNGQGSRKAA